MKSVIDQFEEAKRKNAALVQKLREAAKQAGLSNPELLVAQAFAESGFDPKAKSKAGALGLLQLMPATAREVGFDPKVDDLTDPDTSIEASVRYGRWLSRQFDKPDELLAAYNMGPTALKRVKAKWGDKWLDHAPKETRDYVAKIDKLTKGFVFGPGAATNAPKEIPPQDPFSPISPFAEAVIAPPEPTPPTAAPGNPSPGTLPNGEFIPPGAFSAPPVVSQVPTAPPIYANSAQTPPRSVFSAQPDQLGSTLQPASGYLNTTLQALGLQLPVFHSVNSVLDSILQRANKGIL